LVREQAKTPQAAQRRYTRVIQDSLSCITKSHWFVGPSPLSGADRALLTNPRVLTLKRKDGTRLLFEASQLFTIIPDKRFPGEYKASTLAYIYVVRAPDVDDGEIIEWHWHPLTTPDRPDPHVHVRVEHPDLYGLPKLHIPSGRVSFEEVMRFLIGDLSVKAERANWETALRESEARFRAFRTWPK
jgi:hypothetical protein